MLNFQPIRFRLPESFEGQEAWFVYETAVNLKATKAIGLDVPSLLVCADEVIGIAMLFAAPQKSGVA